MHQVKAETQGTGAPILLFLAERFSAGNITLPEMHHVLASTAGDYGLQAPLGGSADQKGVVADSADSAEIVALHRSADGQVTTAVRWEKVGGESVRLSAVRTSTVHVEVDGAEETTTTTTTTTKIELDSISAVDPGEVEGVTWTDDLGRHRQGWGISSGVSDEAIIVATLHQIFRFDLETAQFTSYPQCDRRVGGAFTGVALGRGGLVYVARYDGLNVQLVATSSLLVLDTDAGTCARPYWDAAGTLLQLVRSMTVSADGLYLVIVTPMLSSLNPTP